MLALRYEQSAQYDKALDYRAKAATLVPPNLRPQAAEAGAQPPRDAVTPDLDPSEVPRKMFRRPGLANQQASKRQPQVFKSQSAMNLRARLGTAAVGARGSGGGSASALEQEMTRHYECDAPLQHGLLAAEMVTKEVTANHSGQKMTL